MAPTAKLISRTTSVGVAAANFDAKDAFGNAQYGYQNLVITNLSPSALVGVGWNGVTATLAGTRDDVRHIGPYGTLTIQYPPLGILSLISDTAATPVEIAGA